MTGFKPYIPNTDSFKQLDESKGRKFYRVQKGRGENVTVVSPTQQTVERAKLDLQRQMEERNQPGPGINSSIKRKRPQSKASRRPRITKKKKPTKRVGKAKPVTTQSICKTKRKYKRS